MKKKGKDGISGYVLIDTASAGEGLLLSEETKQTFDGETMVRVKGLKKTLEGSSGKYTSPATPLPVPILSSTFEHPMKDLDHLRGSRTTSLENWCRCSSVLFSNAWVL